MQLSPLVSTYYHQYFENLESFPNYTITVVTEDTKKLVSILENGKIDFAIALETSTSSRFKFTNLFNDQIEMAISPVHSIAKKKTLAEMI